MFSLPESFIWSLEEYNTSFVVVKCGSLPQEKVIKKINEFLHEYWDKVYEETVKRFKYFDKEGYFPLTLEESFPVTYMGNAPFLDKKSIIIRFSPIYIPYCYGEFCIVYEACTAIEAAFKELKQRYSEINYYGLINFPWSDRRCGDVECYVISDEEHVNKYEDLIKKIVGKIIIKAVNCDFLISTNEFKQYLDPFLDKLEEEITDTSEDELTEICKFLKENKEFLDKYSLEEIGRVILRVLKEGNYEDIEAFIKEELNQIVFHKNTLDKL